MFRYRKIFLIIGFILATCAIALLLFYFFFYTKKTITIPVEQPDVANQQTKVLPASGDGQLPIPATVKPSDSGQDQKTPEYKIPSQKANGGLTQSSALYEKPIYGSTLAPNGQDIMSYDKTEGKFIRISPDGKINYMSDKVFYNVDNVVWSPTKNEAVIEYPDGANILYNFKTKKQSTLPKHWENFSFSPQGGQIAAKSLSDNVDYNWLVVSSQDGSTLKPIERLGENFGKVYNNWSPNNQIIAMYTESKDFDRQNLYFVGQNGENFPLTIIEGRGFEGLWSKTGDQLLYNVYNSASSFKPLLWTVTTEGDAMSQYRKKININTWASKCSFYSNNDLYCAVPEALPDGSGIYPEIADAIPDNIYKIDIATGGKKFIARPEDNATIEKLFISEDEKYLYYTNKTTGIIKKILLK
ncbi:MAG: hypothetical protein V1891_03315 [bacterium]